MKPTADHVIGEPSLYGRKSGPTIASQSSGSRLGGFEYDPVNQRMFVHDGAVNAWTPHGRILIFDVSPAHLHDNRTELKALAVLGQPDFTGYTIGGVGPNTFGSIDEHVLDVKNQRLYVTDRANNRVLVWDVDPRHLIASPPAMAVLGQPGFTTKAPAAGANGLNRPGALIYDEKTDRLFVADGGNNRVLVFDMSRGVHSNMAASLVLGQDDFTGHEAGLSAKQLRRPANLGYEKKYGRLFVADRGNERLLVFDVRPGVLKNGLAATNVLGQPDFTSSSEPVNAKKWKSGVLIDQRNERLFDDQDGGNRMLVFDILPSHLKNDPDATNLLWKKDWDQSTDEDAALLDQVQTERERPRLDEEHNILYSTGGYEGRNGVTLWNVDPKTMKAVGEPAFGGQGQYDWDGHFDFNERSPNGTSTPRTFYPRGIALDTVDHRLFINDQYMQRVLLYQLDDQNRPLDRDAIAVLGQPNAYTAALHPPGANTLHIPLNLAYDPIQKLLFVADGRFNRIMVFDARPGHIQTFDSAVAVIGQKDFGSIVRSVGKASINMGVTDGSGITSTAPTPIGFALDLKRHRLFFSDGANNRVLVYDISPGKVRTGMEASAVIGQSDFASNMARTDDEGFTTPNELAYDDANDRLFVVDGGNHRLLVFKAAPDDIHLHMKAYAVLGQKDFAGVREAVRLDTTKVDEEVGRSRFRMPSSVAYDPVRQRLYVNDKGNDRVLAFDASPEHLKSGMQAEGVFGQKDFVSRIGGEAEQEQLQDPRQIAFDSEQQRLYVTDSFFARLVMYDLPRTERSLVLASHGTVGYSTLDAWNGRTDRPGMDNKSDWRGAVKSDGAVPGATIVYDETHELLDSNSLRRSRLLVSETSLAAPLPARSQLYFIAQNGGKDNQVILSNPGNRPAHVKLTLLLAGANASQQRTIAAGGQLVASLADIFDKPSGIGSLRVNSDVEVAGFVIQKVSTARGEQLLLAIPGAIEGNDKEEPVMSDLRWGGGYRTGLALINPYQKPIRGAVAFFDDRGKPLPVSGESNEVPYEIRPDGAFTWERDSGDLVAKGAYAIVKSSGSEKPSGGAVVSLWDKDTLISQRLEQARTATIRGWVPVDTNPSLTRSGETTIAFTLANPSDWTPAAIRVMLFDASGREKGRYEGILPPGTQHTWTLSDLFNVSRTTGSVRFWIDTPVGLSARRTTVSLRGEPVESDIGYLAEDAAMRHSVELPGILDGQGLATEVLFSNPSEAPLKPDWRFFDQDGMPKQIILR